MAEITPLEEQLVNELRSLLRPLNDKYKDFIHLNIMTLVPVPAEDMCNECKNNEFEPLCERVVVGVHEVGEYK